MKKYYFTYLMYILEHKKNFFKVAWKKKMYWEAITHDNSKFSKDEFKAYAEWFHSDYGVKVKNKYRDQETETKHNRCRIAFDKAWKHHYSCNPHHWNFWMYDNTETPVPMNEKYIKEMICDWEAMSLKFGDNPQTFYIKNYNKIKLHKETRLKVEKQLHLINSDKTLKEEIISRKENYNHGFIINILNTYNLSIDDLAAIIN